MPFDRLDALLQRFSVSARMFHSGALCGINDFAPREGLGQLHLVRRGPLRVEHRAGRAQRIERPSLLFYPRPCGHRFISDAKVGADMACAHVEFRAGTINPIAQALPPVVVMPLDELDGAEPVLESLFREAFGRRCGRQAVVDRLFEVVLIQILRTLMDRGTVAVGLLAGLANPKLAKSLVALHAAPAREWTLERLARSAGMSRSSYACKFRQVLGTTPGDYVTAWRLALAQDALRRGRPVKLVVAEVGYGSTAALSRAFKASCGLSPREWKARHSA